MCTSRLHRVLTSPAGASPAGASPDGASPAGASPDGASPAGASPAGASPAGASPDGASPAGDWVTVENAAGQVLRVSLLAFEGERPRAGDWLVVHSGYALQSVDSAQAAAIVDELRAARTGT